MNLSLEVQQFLANNYPKAFKTGDFEFIKEELLNDRGIYENLYRYSSSAHKTFWRDYCPTETKEQAYEQFSMTEEFQDAQWFIQMANQALCEFAAA